MQCCGLCRRPMHMCRCTRRCCGEFVKKFRVYKTCCFDIVAVCHHCGHEFEHRRHHHCPACGGPLHEPPRMEGFGMGQGMDGMGGMGGMGGRYGSGSEEEE